MSSVKRMVWDIETSPNIGYFWRPGYKVRIPHENIIQERAVICVCWKWVGEDYVYSLTWDDGDDYRMINTFLGETEKADELIAHNGDRFDLTWFQGRCLQHELGPIPEFKTVDTLAISRRKFNFNSHTLEYLAQTLCGHGKLHTDFGLWIDVCNGDKKALNRMVEYCENDVIVLEEVWEKIEPYYRPKTHAGVYQGHPRWTCVGCGSESVVQNKKRISAAGIPRYQFKCKDCGRYYTIANNVYEHYLDAKGIT